MGRLWMLVVLACALAGAVAPPTTAGAAGGAAIPAVVAPLSALTASAGTTMSGPAGVVPDRRQRPRPDACGKRPRKANGRYWRCTFVDRFDGDRLDRRRWFRQRRNTQVPGDQCQWGGPRHVAVRRGALRLTARPAPESADCAHVGGSVSTYHRFSQQYGRFEARVRVRRAEERGLQEAFWLWPDARFDDGTRWPAAGEIDIVETYSRHPDLAIPFLHYTWNDNGGPKPGVNTAWDCKAERGRWHVYRLLWGPDRIRIDVDGKRCLVNTSGDPAFDKRYIVALTQALGGRGNLPTAETPLPATMSVDYVKVWR